ncbi:SDR family NAD(P)-dependent oxidoreductase [Rhizobium leguminosarum]
MPDNSTLSRFSIDGRSAIVTGAGSGIGLAYAETMADAGAYVTLADIDLPAVNREAERLRSEGKKARAVALDIVDPNAVAEAFDDHVTTYGTCDIVFANAGIAPGKGFWNLEGFRNEDSQIDTLDLRIWDKVISTNLSGTFYTLREAARVMKRISRGGAIIVTSSDAALQPAAVVCSPYMPSKAGVSHLTRQAALELAEYGIRVNSIAPGMFATNISDGWVSDPAVRDKLNSAMLMGKIADTDQIKPLALFLASDASSYLTGAQIVIDGGGTLGNFR